MGMGIFSFFAAADARLAGLAEVATAILGRARLAVRQAKSNPSWIAAAKTV